MSNNFYISTCDGNEYEMQKDYRLWQNCYAWCITDLKHNLRVMLKEEPTKSVNDYLLEAIEAFKTELSNMSSSASAEIGYKGI